MYKYGFELEGFFCDKDGKLDLPPKDLPVDGFPGVIELRTSGASSLEDAYMSIFRKFAFSSELRWVMFCTSEATFSPEQKRLLRKERHFTKDQVDIRNIYGKKPRSLGNKNIASLQINISNMTQGSYTKVVDGYIRTEPERYGLLDIPRIVTALDKAFADDIRRSKRQPGEYCIKGDRLEYRSLPNFVFPLDITGAVVFLDKIKKAMEGKL